MLSVSHEGHVRVSAVRVLTLILHGITLLLVWLGATLWRVARDLEDRDEAQAIQLRIIETSRFTLSDALEKEAEIRADMPPAEWQRRFRELERLVQEHLRQHP